MNLFKNKTTDEVMDYRFVDRDKIKTVEDIKVILDYMQLFAQALPYHPVLDKYYVDEKNN